jgi:hypothetical protein
MVGLQKKKSKKIIMAENTKNIINDSMDDVGA